MILISTTVVNCVPIFLHRKLLLFLFEKVGSSLCTKIVQNITVFWDGGGGGCPARLKYHLVIYIIFIKINSKIVYGITQWQCVSCCFIKVVINHKELKVFPSMPRRLCLHPMALNQSKKANRSKDAYLFY